ncbi:MAG: tRNA 4-thiouridine(8) synthase ThiI [Candidatus Omnitrophica bacterium]|nr:tRNA 4-thiouridine(8) synthase ThiI [Candidatus Omnitrophota bacterium]
MKAKALALISGGLDSLLAAKIICDQGIEVTGVHFKIPFCKLNIKDKFPDIGIRIIEPDLGKEFLGLIKNPRYGFGSNMNPCIDCKILMFRKAKKLMRRLKASFVVTGEVLGQRPMSQNRQALSLIQKKSGLGDLLLRPLSAQFFSPSLAESKGWVKRDKLLKLNGRSRNVQIRLARDLGLLNYSTPAGGCLLTDPCFSKRLKELIKHNELNLDNLELLKLGRHFRVDAKTRLVVGRDEKENNLILHLTKPGDYLLVPQKDLAGPTCLIRGEVDQKSIFISAQIISAYTDVSGLKEIKVAYKKVNTKPVNTLKIACVSKADFMHLLIK